MYRVSVSSLKGLDRGKRWPVNFNPKGYPLRKFPGAGTAAKAKDPNTGKIHFMIICGVYQLFISYTRKKARDKDA
jgi:hypothetical protein